MKNTIKDITEQLINRKITKSEADKLLLDLLNINDIENIEQPEIRDRGCCDECGEGYDNEEEWLYNTECELCGHPIPENLIVKKPFAPRPPSPPPSRFLKEGDEPTKPNHIQ